ncbi:hypothetical protein M011DRAFT_4346 [Sporormia fimetaria CBS 119925]|uniref:Uncharacterized protein n=1 Tax=Sporormia fimetaria CBS 119925 TaxID=1340428 RepID=A0A6A6VPF6_9PLEO|nr:hypothetical protein M011DRAFT_4346 [Sporormia fimetaria CBS 119925]
MHPGLVFTVPEMPTGKRVEEPKSVTKRCHERAAGRADVGTKKTDIGIDECAWRNGGCGGGDWWEVVGFDGEVRGHVRANRDFLKIPECGVRIEKRQGARLEMVKSKMLTVGGWKDGYPSRDGFRRTMLCDNNQEPTLADHEPCSPRDSQIMSRSEPNATLYIKSTPESPVR